MMRHQVPHNRIKLFLASVFRKRIENLHELKQLECLRPEDAPRPHDYPYYWVILDPKSKEDKVKVTHLKNLPKLYMFQSWHKLKTRHIFWSCLMRFTNMKWIWRDTERTRFCPQTDRRKKWSQYIHLSTSLNRGWGWGWGWGYHEYHWPTDQEWINAYNQRLYVTRNSSNNAIHRGRYQKPVNEKYTPIKWKIYKIGTEYLSMLPIVRIMRDKSLAYVSYILF